MVREKRDRLEDDLSQGREKKGRLEENTEADFVTPLYSSNEYKSFVLPNGLTTILISSEGEDTSSASMAVRLGTFDDPMEFLGLAHLIEHMVFRGSKKYPGTESNDFVDRHGGDCNATTEAEYTIYDMSIPSKHFEDALDRFAHLFIDPLFELNAIESEVYAMNSEFELLRLSDTSRLERLKGYTSVAGHMFSKFDWVTLESLKDKISLQSKAQSLFSTGYVAGSMKLAVYGAESCQVLERWVRKSFECVRRGSGIQRSPIPPSPVWSSSSYVLKAVQDLHVLEITWMIPATTDIKYKPEIFLAQALCHECEGSLLSFFKNKGWANSITVTAGVDVDNVAEYDDKTCHFSSTSFGKMFVISFDLTLAGVDKKFEMISSIYQYLNTVRRQPFKQLMDEYRQTREIEFDCLEIDTNALDFTHSIAVNMLHAPVNHALSLDYLDRCRSTTADIEKILAYFIPDNMRIDLVTSSFKSQDFLTEPFYNLQYTEEIIPIDYMNKWGDTAQVFHQFRLPPVNNYIPERKFIEAKLLVRVSGPEDGEPEDGESEDGEPGVGESEGEPEPEDGESEPEPEDDFEPEELVVDNISFFYKHELCIPSVKFSAFLNCFDGMPNRLMIMLYGNLVKDSLSEIFYQGRKALFKSNVLEAEHNKIGFQFQGYGESLLDFISTVWQKFNSLTPATDRFEAIKKALATEISNRGFVIEDQSVHLTSEMLSDHSLEVEELENITLLNFTEFLPKMRSKIFIQGIVYGDLTKVEAEKILERIRSVTLSKDPVPVGLRGIQRANLPIGIKTLNEKVKSKCNANSLAKIYYQIGTGKFNAKQTSLLQLFSQMLNDYLTEQLRTRENLSYWQCCETHFSGGLNGMFLAVASPLHDPSYLLARLDNVMVNFVEGLVDLDDGIFRDYKRTMLSAMKDVGGDEIWVMVNEERYRRGFYSEVKSVLKQLEKADLRDFYNEYFSDTSFVRRRASICIWGCNSSSRE